MSELDAPVNYRERTRHYYRALGYETDYVWAYHDDVPFARLARPLAQARVALVTTASPIDRSNVDPAGRKQVWSAPSTPTPQRLFTDDVAWDKESTHTDDVESFLPLGTLAQLARDGYIGGAAARFHGVPTEYSQRLTVTRDAPAILDRLREDAADAALLSAL